MNRRVLTGRWTWLAVAAAFALPSVGPAQEEIAAGKAPEAQGGQGKEEKPKRFPDVAEAVKDMQALEGLFTLYRFDPSDKERDPEKLLCKIPKGLLEEDLLFATSISRGGALTGWMWRTYLIRWEVVGNQLKLVTPETRYVVKKDKPVTDVVERTYNDSYLASVPIVAMSQGGDPVIDLGPLLKSNLADVAFLGGNVRGDISRWTKVKVFPDNVLIDVDLALGAREGGGRMVGVSYAFRRLPKLGSYTPRAADDRIGYFLTARIDWSRKHEERDTFERYINRWKLEKRDPSLELSPPRQPITFIIEKTVPIQWRRWVREGILEWNKAFEKIGFVDAIVVQQQTEDNEFADYDPEDARYNFFRWIVSGRSFAMGPSRVDPRTGQILDADIIMDDSFVRVFMHEFDLLAPAALESLKGPGPELWRQQYPELAGCALFSPLERLRDAQPAADDEEARLVEIAHQKLHAGGLHVCTYATGLRQQLAFVRSALIATGSGKKLPERFIGEAIKEVVTHEVGHTLGLRHNFKASSWLSLEEVKSRRDSSDEPTCASVMDYNPLLFFKGDTPESVRHFVTPTIGPWDYWVIEYGYAEPPKGKSEEELLKEIAARCTRPELAYATDEDTSGPFSPDPASNRYDMAADPIAWAQSRIEICDALLPDVLHWSIQDGESRYFARQAFQTLWFEKARNFEFGARLVGGQYFHRDHKGDPDARPAFELVDPELQRRTLAWLGQTLLNDEFFKVDAAVWNELAPSRWSHFGSSAELRLDFPIHDWILMLQSWALADLVSPPVLQRIYDAELKSTADNKYTAAEHIRTLNSIVWRQLAKRPSGPYSDAAPFISSIDRNLQRAYLDVALAYARMQPGSAVSADLSSMIRQSLRELSEQITRGLAIQGLDFASRAHLTDCKSRIDRVLEAQFVER